MIKGRGAPVRMHECCQSVSAQNIMFFLCGLVLRENKKLGKFYA